MSILHQSTELEFKHKQLMYFRKRVRPLQLRLLNDKLQAELHMQHHPLIRVYGILDIAGCPLAVVNAEDSAKHDIHKFLEENVNYATMLYELEIADNLDQAKELAKYHYTTDAELIYNLWTKACDEVHELMQDFVNQSYDTAISAIEDRWDNIPTV